MAQYNSPLNRDEDSFLTSARWDGTLQRWLHDSVILGPDGQPLFTVTMPGVVNVVPSVTDVTLQNAAAVPGNGTAYSPSGNCVVTLEVRGTSTSRRVVFELAGPSGVYVPHTAVLVTDPTVMATETTGGSNAEPETWQVEVPAGWSFRARVAEVTGGNVTIVGKAVI